MGFLSSGLATPPDMTHTWDMDTEDLLRRAALWEAEANSGFKPHRRETCLREAARLFQEALETECSNSSAPSQPVDGSERLPPSGAASSEATPGSA